MSRSLLHLAAATPIALSVTGCALRPWTPAVSVVYSPDSCASQTVAVPPRSAVAAQWQLPVESPWARYEKHTLIASLDDVPRAAVLPAITQLGVVEDAQRAAVAVAAAGLPSDTMWLVDLRGAASVAFAAALSQRANEPVAPVLTFNNWPAEDELIPAEETLAALLTMSPRLPAPDASFARPVFLLDAWRLAYRFDEPGSDVTDNRYALNPTDLPDAEVLRQNGIRRVLYLVENLDDTETEEDDLNALFLEYQRAGITIFMVDLNFLAREIIAPNRWHDVYERRVLYVEHRRTLLEDPLFYARARGGFGGLHLGPSPFAGGFGHGFGFGGG